MEQEREFSPQEEGQHEPVEELNPNMFREDITDERAETPVLEEYLREWREGLAEMEKRPDLYAEDIEKMKRQIEAAERDISSRRAL